MANSEDMQVVTMHMSIQAATIEVRAMRAGLPAKPYSKRCIPEKYHRPRQTEPMLC